MNHKERILQFIDYKEISKREFCRKSILSHTIFNNDSAIGVDKLEKIYNAYPELNMDWVITGRGEMIYDRPEAAFIMRDNGVAIRPSPPWREKYFEVLEKYNQCLEAAALKHQAS